MAYISVQRHAPSSFSSITSYHAEKRKLLLPWRTWPAELHWSSISLTLHDKFPRFTFPPGRKMVAPKRHFLPFLLISVSALFIVSRYHASLPLSSPLFNPNPNLTLTHKSTASQSPEFTLIIKVLAFNRLDSLSRCLRSLANADYLTDTVHLHVYVDHFVHNESTLRLNESHQILEFVDKFDWRFGDKLVHYRTGNVGLQAQWLEAWWPSSNNEFAFVVEDDLEVSPLYYKFLRSLIVNYYYNVSNFSPSIYGASLQRPRFVPGKHGNKIRLDDKTRLFLYQLVGTWGQLLFPKPWKEFRLWYDKHKAMGSKPIIEGMVTTGWYKRMGERIWTPWFIKFIHSRGYFNIYTNFLQERALSVSHRDAGVNYGKTAGPDSFLIDDERSLDFNPLEMQPMSDLKWYDFCFREVNPGRIVKNFNELGSVLNSMQKQEMIILVSLLGVSTETTKNLICHFESLNIRNYMFLGPESEFLFDLARRGIPVIVRDQFLTSVKGYKTKTYGGLRDEPVKEIIAKVYVTEKCLDNGFDILLVDGHMLLLNMAPFPFLQSHSASDFYAGQRLDIFFAGSSSNARKIWADIASNVVAMVESVNKGSAMEESLSFRLLAAKLGEEKGVEINWVDEMSSAVQIGESNGNYSILENGKKMVFWSADSSADVVQKRLEQLGLWIVDPDLSCKAVVCHQS